MSHEDPVMAIPKQGPVVAVDGPAGTGKSSVTKRLAELLGFVHVDTGALYRATAYLALEGSPADPNEVNGELAAQIARDGNFEFRREVKKNPANRVYVNGRDVTTLIRTPEISLAASKVATFAAVRAALLGLQRRLGCRGHAILEGRDIGTVIFPDADVKFFLVASVEERAKRRLSELEASGADPISFDELKKQIQARDLQDSSRAVAPLKRAPGAIEIDTTSLTLDQVVETMEQTIRQKIPVLAAQTGRPSGGPK